MLMLLIGEQFKIFLLCYMCCGGSKIRIEDVFGVGGNWREITF
jgi:hypothetical protein